MLLVVDAENPLVERPVVQLAERDPVFHVIRAVQGALTPTMVTWCPPSPGGRGETLTPVMN
jgi:hypothetical protein